MKSFEAGARRDLLLLSLTAGGADAVGYLGLGYVFTSNMTGNVVLLGIALGEGHVAAVQRTLCVLAVFMLGLGLGAKLAHEIGKEDWPRMAARLIGLEKVALLFFTAGWLAWRAFPALPLGYALLASLSLAMGLQSAALNRLSAPGLGTTAITGTLTALVTGAVGWFFSRAAEDAEARRYRVLFQLGVVALYGCGAAVSGFLMLQLPPLAGCFPLLAVLGVGRAPFRLFSRSRP